MKSQQVESTRKLISEIQAEFSLSQKSIARLINLKEPELSKAKNPKTAILGELSEQRRKEIIDLLEDLKNNYEPASQPIKPTDSLIDPEKNESDESNIRTLRRLNESEIKNTIILGCVLSGVLAVIMVWLFKDYTGYENMSRADFNELLPFSFLSFVLIGLYIGWISAFTIKRLIRVPTTWNYIVHFLLIFAVSFVFAGIKSRDSYLLCKFTNRPCNGLLGEPNFEILGIASALAICGFGLVKVIYHNRFQSWYEILSYSVLYSVLGTCAFALFDQLHNVLTQLGWIVDKDHFINSAIFKYSFSHPERVPAIWVQVFLSMLITLSLVRYRVSAISKALPFKTEM
jgi:hypothetical protein